jgi:hypothetical protein
VLAAWRGARLVVPVLLSRQPGRARRVREHPYSARELVVQRRGHVTEEMIRRATGLLTACHLGRGRAAAPGAWSSCRGCVPPACGANFPIGWWSGA